MEISRNKGVNILSLEGLNDKDALLCIIFVGAILIYKPIIENNNG